MLIAHITDPHVVEKGQLACRTADTGAMRAKVVAKINALTPRPDVALLLQRPVDLVVEVIADLLRPHLYRAVAFVEPDAEPRPIAGCGVGARPAGQGHLGIAEALGLPVPSCSSGRDRTH